MAAGRNQASPEKMFVHSFANGIPGEGALMPDGQRRADAHWVLLVSAPPPFPSPFPPPPFPSAPGGLHALRQRDAVGIAPRPDARTMAADGRWCCPKAGDGGGAGDGVTAEASADPISTPV